MVGRRAAVQTACAVGLISFFLPFPPPSPHLPPLVIADRAKKVQAQEVIRFCLRFTCSRTLLVIYAGENGR
jgi:hypothetical protein